MAKIKLAKKNEASTAIRAYTVKGGRMDDAGTIIEEWSVDPESGKTPEQQIWDEVKAAASDDYEQSICVNDREYRYGEVFDDGITLETFKRDNGIDKITSMSYLVDGWNTFSDIRVYEIGANESGKAEAFDKDAIDRFTVDDPNYIDHFVIHPDDSDVQAIVKITKVPGSGQFKVIALHSGFANPVTLMSGTFFGAAHEYEELADMDPAEALVMIASA